MDAKVQSASAAQLNDADDYWYVFQREFVEGWRQVTWTDPRPRQRALAEEQFPGQCCIKGVGCSRPPRLSLFAGSRVQKNRWL